MIAENIYASVDAEGNEYVLSDEIIDHKKDQSAVTIANHVCLQGTGVTQNQGGLPLVGNSLCSVE